MDTSFTRLATLRSMDPDHPPVLEELGIHTIGDLLAFPPWRRARYVMAARDRLLRKEEILHAIDDSVHDRSIEQLADASVEVLRGVGRQTAALLVRMGMGTVRTLAAHPLFAEAEALIAPHVDGDTDPSAPGCVIPRCRNFSRNSKKYVSFFRQEEVRGLSIRSAAGGGLGSLFHFGDKDIRLIHLGYSVSYVQDWIYGGIHLGEPQGSVNLFMGQDTQVSTLDWRRAVSALRRERSGVSEQLSSTLFHQRAVDEVARATAEEHQHGATSAFGANAAGAGSFVAAGAILGGVGGGVSGALAGLAVDALTGGATAGLGTLSGAVAGTAVGSMAGAAAGSLVFSGATALGFVETDAEGDRSIVGRSAQNIQQRTVQNSSSIRSFWSTVISQSVQEEQQEIRTDRVTNHNRIHALNALYFEVLNEYRVNISVDEAAPLLFLPFKPFTFTEDTLRRYWWIIRTLLRDRALVSALDTRFLSLVNAPSPAVELAALPDIEDIESSEIEIDVNIDGSMLESLITSMIETAALGIAVGPVVALFHQLFDAAKRENVRVELLTSDGTVSLARVNSPNQDPNFVGRYRTRRTIALHSIRALRVSNDNAEFDLFGLELDKLAFEGLLARVDIRNRSRFSAALPDLGQLTTKRALPGGSFTVRANRSRDIAWDIADRLRAQFDGINAERAELEEELGEQALIDAQVAYLLDFLNANKFGFTRMILEHTEREQLIAVLEGVKVGGVDLSRFAGTTPVGFCGNHVVLPLRRCALPAAGDAITIEVRKLLEMLGRIDEAAEGGDEGMNEFVQSAASFLDQFLPLHSGAVLSARDTALLEQLHALAGVLEQYLRLGGSGRRGRATARPGAAQRLLRRRIEEAVRDILAFILAPVEQRTDEHALLCRYHRDTVDALRALLGTVLSSSEVSLPSPAVFMEPVLSNAKGAELYDMRRNSHYELLQAPGIGVADPNVQRANDPQLTPTVPAATLTIQNAPNLPLPNALNAVIAEAGKLDLSTLISSNAGTLTSTLANLANVAGELAKASAQLTGDAQQQVLEQAGQLARQVSDTIGSVIRTPPSPPPAAPPSTPQERRETVREAERIDSGPGTPEQKRQRKQVLGLPASEERQREYRLSIVFLDERNAPYRNGEFTTRLNLPNEDFIVDINGGLPVDMDRGQFRFPDVFTLPVGRSASVQIDAVLEQAAVPGFREFVLPDKPDLLFKCRMQSEKHSISSTDVKSAVDEVVKSSSFGAAINPIFSRFLNAGVEFPFRIFEIKADGGGKAELNLRLEYNRASSQTTTTTTGNTTVTQYEVIIPRNAWDIEVI